MATHYTGLEHELGIPDILRRVADICRGSCYGDLSIVDDAVAEARAELWKFYTSRSEMPNEALLFTIAKRRALKCILKEADAKVIKSIGPGKWSDDQGIDDDSEEYWDDSTFESDNSSSIWDDYYGNWDDDS